jgi:hypothetical protein
MERQVLGAIVDLVRLNAVEALYHCLQCAEEIEMKYRKRQDTENPQPQYEQQPLDIKVIE